MQRFGGLLLSSVVAVGLTCCCDAYIVLSSVRRLPRTLAQSRPGLASGVVHARGLPLRVPLLATPQEDEDADVADPLSKQALGLDTPVGGFEPAPAEDYPINLPSYALLGISATLAIAFVGSIFEVTGSKEPLLGLPLTVVIGILSLPSFLFLFYAAIKKGQAEAEEEDIY